LPISAPPGFSPGADWFALDGSVYRHFPAEGTAHLAGENVPPAVSKSFTALIPTILTLSLFAVLAAVLATCCIRI
jgi:cellobiose-specific phosphotransferase system component IIC